MYSMSAHRKDDRTRHEHARVSHPPCQMALTRNSQLGSMGSLIGHKTLLSSTKQWLSIHTHTRFWDISYDV